MNVVIYARFSSHSQTEQSIDGQLRVCKEYAERNKLNIIGEYIDRATTGTNADRPEFQKMIDASYKKEFEQILVYKFDRFSRNKYDNVVYKHKLSQNGVKVVSATEIINDTPEGALMEGLLEMFAEMYSKDLSQKVKRGIRESVLKGNFIGGHILYGYKVEDKKIVIDEKTAPAIRYMFEEYANGKSKKQIIRELNEMGYKTAQGKPITFTSFQNNLSNIKYTGMFDNGELQNENYYPAIISKEIFDKVQIKLAEHKHAPATQKAKIEYLLTGKAFCGYCGAPMVGVSGTSKTSAKHYYYACSTRYKTHTCNKTNERKANLERYVVEQTLDYVLKHEQIENIANGMLEIWNKNSTVIKIKELERKIEKIDKDLDKCFNSFFNADSEELQKRINEKAKSLEIEKKDIQAEINKLKVMQVITYTKDDIKNLLAEFLDGNINDINYQRKIINKFVNTIYIFDDKIAIYYNLFNTRKFTYEEALENIAENEKVLISNTLVRQEEPNPNPCGEIGFFFFQIKLKTAFYAVENHLTMSKGVISCVIESPKRASLTLLQEILIILTSKN